MLNSSLARGALVLTVLFSATVGAFVWLSPQAQECPPGYRMRDPADVTRRFHEDVPEAIVAKIHAAFGERICVRRKLPESFTEIEEAQDANVGRAGAPPGTLRKALAQKQAMEPLKAKVANAAAHWEPYGTGPQVSDPAYPEGANDGIPEVAGRADNFAYDPAAKRLFVAIGTGGIWVSEAIDGDVGTLGDQWRPISGGLPTQIASAVAWTTAEGGRILVLTGEHVQGGNTYVGLGAFWSDDLGQSWHQATGAPDATNAARLAVDASNPSIVYAATGRGLFRSEDAGESYVNVGLPVSADCAGVVAETGPCQLANVVTDVVVKAPDGTPAIACGADGCPVLAAVGYRSGALPYADGKPQSPGNGLYRSDTGKPGTFARVGTAVGEIQDVTGGLLPIGFAPQPRIGRVELGNAIGPAQNHNYVYAIVQDAVLLNGGLPILDLPTDAAAPDLSALCSLTEPIDPTVAELCALVVGGVLSPTSFNGIYVSPDFGDTWIRLADDIEITYAGIVTGSSLAAAVALGVGPGVQAWYNTWIKPDPTTSIGGIPTRLLFGLEEIWKNRLNIPVTGLEQTPSDFKVIGTYFAGNTCLFLLGNAGLPGLPVCPFRDGLLTNITTTHPDQHDGIFIADEQRGGVWLFAGGDGGVFKQYSSDPLTDDFDNTKWGNGANRGFYTLMNYGIGVARDGTVYYGLQDNSSGKIEPDTRRQVRVYIGDGVYAAVDPDDSQTAYYQTPGLSIVKTTDGGATYDFADPGAAAGAAHFLSPFVMDPRDADHLVAAGTLVAATIDGTETWETVFDLGTDETSGAPHQSRSLALDAEGDAVYAGWCGPCNVNPGTTQFQRGIATNVGGDKPPAKGTPDGWHQASLSGLPNRYIYNIEIDPQDPKTVYVALGGYSTARWLSAGQYLDENPAIGSGHVFKSTDAGETFTDISGNLPDVVATAIIRAGKQLIVGTDIGAFISSNLDGSEWAPLGDLPNVPINQFVLNPADSSRVFAATFGRGVQTLKLTETAGSDSVPRDNKRFGGVLPLGLLALLFSAAWMRSRRR
jgi:hypothetical protein